MLSDYPAGELKFEGLGASGASAEEAARLLAASLAGWTAAHGDCRVLQLSMLPAAPENAQSGPAARSFGAMALITYVDAVLDGAVAAEAVAAAVEEIHVAQVLRTDEPAPPDDL